jgi:hypothetical protein
MRWGSRDRAEDARMLTVAHIAGYQVESVVQLGEGPTATLAIGRRCQPVGCFYYIGGPFGPTVRWTEELTSWRAGSSLVRNP